MKSPTTHQLIYIGPCVMKVLLHEQCLAYNLIIHSRCLYTSRKPPIIPFSIMFISVFNDSCIPGVEQSIFMLMQH